MTFLRNVASDLVAKRLWPVALALVLAILAAPVLLAGDEPAPPPPVALPGTDKEAGGDGQLLALAEERAALRGAGGRVDPFREPPKPPKASGGASGGSGGADPAMGEIVPDFGTGTGTGTGSLGDAFESGVDTLPGVGGVGVTPVPGTGGAGGGGTTPAPVPEDEADELSYHVDLRVGRTNEVRPVEDVARLSPLPSAEDPFLVFLGVAEDGESATFLVSSDAVPTGTGTCEPSPEQCERIRLRATDTEYFDVTTDEGELVQYELEVRRIEQRVGPTAKAASVARARESAEGRALLREAVAEGDVDISDLSYSKELGLVVPAGAAKAARAPRPAPVPGGFRADVRYGPAEGELVKRYHLARLTPLPSAQDPAFVFLGVVRDGEAAQFLNPTGAAVSGDGVCRPDDETCNRIEVPAGGTAVVDVRTIDGRTAEHHLVVDAITEIAAAGEQEADELRRRESPTGRAILRRLIREVGTILADVDFDVERGTLVERPAG